MDKERAAILKMLESGKISAEDANKLLNAINQPGRPTMPIQGLTDSPQPAAKNRLQIGKGTLQELEEKSASNKLGKRRHDSESSGKSRQGQSLGHEPGRTRSRGRGSQG